VSAGLPLELRLAWRYLRARTGERFLSFIAGVGVLGIVDGDTLDASISQGVHTQLGPLDAVAPIGDGNTEPVERALTPLIERGTADGVLPITTATVTVAAGSDTVVAEPDATLVEIDFARAVAFGGRPDETGIEGPTPQDGEAVIGEDLASTLDVEPGDAVRLFAYGAERELRVIGELDQRGLAGLQLNANNGSSSPTIFVKPGTIGALAAGAPGAGEMPFTYVGVSAPGDASVVTGEAFRAQVQQPLAAAGLNDTVTLVKKDLRDAAKALGDSFTELFGMIGLFSVFAGILLLVNIFVMLAQERQSELGMLRAIGLRRVSLVGSFSLEGWMYSVASAALGTIVGIGVGRVIVIVASGLFAGGGPAGQGGLDLLFTATRASTSAGFFLGFLISLVTVVLTSVRVSRLNVIRAIRDLPEPTVHKRRAITLVAGAFGVVVGALVTMGGISGESAASVLLGPCVVAVGAIPLLTRIAPRRVVVSVASASTLAWAVFAFAFFPRAFRDAAIAVFLIQGIVLVASAVALLSQNQVAIGAAVRAVSGGSQRMALRLGLAYPLARTLRTSMTLAMYALVVYVLATITIFSSIFGSQIDEFTKSVSGGFDLVVETNGTNPIPVDELRAVEGVQTVAPIASAYGEWTPLTPATSSERGAKGPTGWPAASFDETFIAKEAPELEQRPAEYATDVDAYRAVLANPDLFIAPAFFLEQGGGPPTPPEVGEQFVLRNTLTGQARTITVAAVAQSGFGNIRPMMSAETLLSVFGDRATPNVFYVDAASGVSADRLAREVNGRFLANGTDASSFVSIVEENLSQQQGFFKLMRGYLALGLVVGIAGLGVVMVRAVRERRREVGVLRSLGFDPAAVRRAFLVESAFVALEGILTGTVLAVVTTWRLSANADFGATMQFHVPWTSLALLVLLTIVASLIATATPAQQASRIRPAVALRIAD